MREQYGKAHGTQASRKQIQNTTRELIMCQRDWELVENITFLACKPQRVEASVYDFPGWLDTEGGEGWGGGGGARRDRDEGADMDGKVGWVWEITD